MARKGYSNSGRGIMGVMVIIIAIVLGLGIFAVARSIIQSQHAANIAGGNATIAERADALGLTTEDFLSLYGLTDSGLTGSSNENEAYEAMTLANYVKYNSGTAPTEEDFEAFKLANELEDDVTLDTTDATVKYMYMTYLNALEEAEQAAQSESLELDGGLDTGTSSLTTDDQTAEDAATE